MILTFRVVSWAFVIVFWFQLYPDSLASVLHESEARSPGPGSPSSLISEGDNRVREDECENVGRASKKYLSFFLKMRNSKNSVCSFISNRKKLNNSSFG